MSRRKPELVKPEGITTETWLFRLESEHRDLMRQLRRSVHTRGYSGASYIERIERAIARAKAMIAEAV